MTGWKRYLGFSTDHKVIGIQYMVTFLVVLLLGGVAALAMRLELAQAGEGILSADRYNQVMSMIGADDMAFPRLNAVTFWLIPPVAIGLLAAPTLGSFDTGWTAYPPLSVINNSGQILFVLAVTTFGLSSILGGLNVVTTIVTMRAPG
ncbi:MAG: cbb3-type cytochrome c oxidase subunit I, partial [Vicinamibacterales bacterium]|nr:cbb3-type cytochrome c oxidase subunit I [Vicinamibacterales bacterium]